MKRVAAGAFLPTPLLFDSRNAQTIDPVERCRIISSLRGKTRWHKRVSNAGPPDPEFYALPLLDIGSANKKNESKNIISLFMMGYAFKASCERINSRPFRYQSLVVTKQDHKFRSCRRPDVDRKLIYLIGIIPTND